MFAVEASPFNCLVLYSHPFHLVCASSPTAGGAAVGGQAGAVAGAEIEAKLKQGAHDSCQPCRRKGRAGICKVITARM